MRSFVIALGIVALVAVSANADVIGYWNFNDTTALGTNTAYPSRINPFGTPEAQTDYAADLGTAALSVWGAGVAGNLAGTNGSATVADNQFGSFAGSTQNALNSDIAGGSLAVTGSGNNGSYFLVKFGSKLEDAVLSYATRGTSTGYDTHSFAYSTDGGATFTDLPSLAAQKNSTWVVKTVDMADVFANSTANIIKISVSGATSTNGNSRFENMQLNGTIVPEPASLALLLVGGLFLSRRR